MFQFNYYEHTRNKRKCHSFLILIDTNYVGFIGKQHKTEVIEILEHMKSIQTNQILDPSACTDTNCKYSRGDLVTQRYVLLERLYQLNCVIAQQNRNKTHSNKHSQHENHHCL